MDSEKTLDSSSSDEVNEEDVKEADTEGNTEEKDSEEHQGRSAEGRIHELLAKNKVLEQKLDEINAKMAPQVPTPQVKEVEIAPEARKVVDYLKELGFVRKEDQEKVFRSVEDRMTLNNEHLRLENVFSGSDGRPKYDRKEVEAFMQKRGIFDPETAYEKLNKEELFDWEVKQYEAKRGKKPFVQKPVSTVGEREDNKITPEKIAEWLKTPEGREKYEQNREKILSMLKKGEL